MRYSQTTSIVFELNVGIKVSLPTWHFFGNDIISLIIRAFINQKPVT
jgi:hypothetical protein